MLVTEAIDGNKCSNTAPAAQLSFRWNDLCDFQQHMAIEEWGCQRLFRAYRLHVENCNKSSSVHTPSSYDWNANEIKYKHMKNHENPDIHTSCLACNNFFFSMLYEKYFSMQQCVINFNQFRWNLHNCFEWALNNSVKWLFVNYVTL